MTLIEEKDIKSKSAESLVVGSFYKNPQLFFEYDELIYPEWDFITNDLRTLYNIIRTCYHGGYKNIDETIINVEVNKVPEWIEIYKKIQGYKTIQRLIDKVNLEDFKVYYKELKKYNLLRELFRKGFPVEQKLEKMKELEVEDIYKYFDYNLANTFSHHQNVEDSIILGKNMVSTLNKYQEEPDIGIEIPYHITNNLIRGWRQRCLNATGMHSGCGKSRWVSNIIFDIGIVKKIPILVIANEDDESIWNAILITSIVNNIFNKHSGKYINETDIITGQLSINDFELCKKAAKYIEENSKIYFQETQVYDYESLRRLLKIHKLKGINYFVYDTFKPFRNSKGATWEGFVQTSEMLKQLCGSKKKDGLDLAGWVTFQLTDDSLFDKILNSNSIASGKQIKHNLNYMSLYRPLTYAEKQKIQIKIYQKDNPFNGELQPLDLFKTYYIGFIDKNKGGQDKLKIIMEVDKGGVVFKELGYAVFKNKEDEDLIENRSGKKSD